MWKIESIFLIYVDDDDDDDKRRRLSEEPVEFFELQWDQSHEEVSKSYVWEIYRRQQKKSNR